MKTKLLLLLITAATLCGCEPLRDRVTYCTYVNGTDKAIIVTLYDRDYRTYESRISEVDPDAKELLSFTIAPGDQYTRTLPPFPSMPKGGIAPPFDDIEDAACITVSNGEKIIIDYSPYGLFNPFSYYYEVTRDTNKSVHIRCMFTDEFFKYGWVPRQKFNE